MKFFKKAKRGFTLVELVVVIAVIAILAAVSVGAYFGIADSANKTKLESEARGVHTNIQLIAQNGNSNCDMNTNGLYVKDLDAFEDKLLEYSGIEYSVVAEAPQYVNNPTIHLFNSSEVSPERLVQTRFDSFYFYTVEVTNKRASLHIASGKITIEDFDFIVGEAPHEHNYNAVVTNPTCTEDGYTTYTCSCGDSYVGNTVAASGHDYDEVVTNPTCTEDGFTTYTCHCGDTYVGNTITAPGHNHQPTVTAPTCTEGGFTTYECECGDTYVADHTNALDHNYTEEVTTAPTCTKEGVKTFTCQNDTAHTYTVEIEKLPHEFINSTYNWSNDYSKATARATCKNCPETLEETVNTTPELLSEQGCLTDGIVKYTAVFTNEIFEAQSETVTVSEKTGHTLGEVTYTLSGDKTQVTATAACSKCSTPLTETVNTSSEKISSQDCETDEVIKYTATFNTNGFGTFEENVVIKERTGHIDGDPVVENEKEASCTAEGSYDLVTRCKVCNEVTKREQKTISTKPHDYKFEKKVNPTCTEKGYDVYKCSCGATENRNSYDATGHNYNSVVTNPTCSQQGYTTYSCKSCDYSYKDNYKAATPHSSFTKGKCNTCSEMKTLYVNASLWDPDSCRVAAYFFDNGTEWVDMKRIDGTNIYTVVVPNKGYPSVIFCRMNKNTTANNWNNKWNQTGNLEIPTNRDDLLTISDWDGQTSGWSTK